MLRAFLTVTVAAGLLLTAGIGGTAAHDARDATGLAALPSDSDCRGAGGLESDNNDPRCEQDVSAPADATDSDADTADDNDDQPDGTGDDGD